MTQADATGWFRDPTGRNEARYFAGGQPTDLVKRDGQELVDPMRGGSPSTVVTATTTIHDEEPRPVPSRDDGQPDASATARSRWVIIGALGLIVAAAIGLLLVRSFVDNGDEPTSAPSTTIDVASTLRTSLCTNATSFGCSVESSPGVIEVYMSKYSVDESDLVDAGNRTGLWTPADVARMLRTRALDGTQRTADGRVSWTYHPDNGLQLVIDASREG